MILEKEIKEYVAAQLDYKPTLEEIEKSIISAAEKANRQITPEYQTQVKSLAHIFVKHGATREEIYEAFDKSRNIKLTADQLKSVEKSAQDSTKKDGGSYEEHYNTSLAVTNFFQGINGYEPSPTRKSQFNDMHAATLKFTEENGIAKEEIGSSIMGNIDQRLSKDEQAQPTTISYLQPPPKNALTSIEQIASELKKTPEKLTASEVAAKILPSAKVLSPDKSGKVIAKDASSNPMCTLTTTKDGKIRFDNIGKNTNGIICIADQRGNHDIVEFKNGNVVRVIDGGGSLDKQNKQELTRQAKINANITATTQVKQGPSSSSVAPSVAGQAQNKDVPRMQK